MAKQVKLELTEEALRVYGSRRRTVAANVQQQQQQQGVVVTVVAAAVTDDPDDLATASMTAFQVRTTRLYQAFATMFTQY
jgi:hypothetical protein